MEIGHWTECLFPKSIPYLSPKSPGRHFGRVTVQTHASSLRSFFQLAELRGWCRTGIAASIMAPRVFQDESLLSAPSWSDVQRLIGDTDEGSPSAIRDHAILMMLAVYLERIRVISKATQPDDRVFTTITGKSAKTLYSSLIAYLLNEANLREGTQGVPRSTYCFRHTYATLRLQEGVDVYFLAEQMGTSIHMIESHYGHVNTLNDDHLKVVGFRSAG
jgi:site-specific recombinase XerD